MNEWRYDRSNRHDVVTIPLVWLAFVLSLLVHVAALWVWLPRMHDLSAANAEMGKASDPRHIAKWRYHIEISNPSGCLMTPYSDDQAIPVPHSEVYRFHLDANRRARLEKVFCNTDKPADAIAVSINGQNYDPVWLLDDSGINYATQLVPRTPLAITPDGRP